MEGIPPPFTEFWKWLGYHLKRDWRVMIKDAPVAFFAVVVFSFVLSYFWVWEKVVPEMNVQLATKQAIIESKQDTIEKLQGELRAAHDHGDASPKKRGHILARELRVFAQQWHGSLETINDIMRYGEEYAERFHMRVDEFIADAKGNGLDVGPLKTTLMQKPGPAATLNEADEIDKLSEKMDD